MPNPYVNKVTVNNATIIDLTSDTAVASDVAAGKYFHLATGERVAGTASGGGGDSAWTKVAETTYTVSTTGTTAQTRATWETGHSEIWTSSKIVYVRIRDVAGKRNGYFYGSDNFFMSHVPDHGSNTTSTRFYWCCTSAGNYGAGNNSGTNGYGVFADTRYSDGRIRIRSRYSSSYSLDINGTYKVEVYLLKPAGGVPIFV